MTTLLLLILAWFAAPALAGEPSAAVERAQQAELERVRAEVAGQVQLSAYDLVDELIYGWTQAPVFAEPTPVVLAGVTVPVGMGTGLQALLENHISSVLVQNPSTNVKLVHCPECTAVVVHSGPEGTVVSRGVDNPRVLEELGVGAGRNALFVDVEAEGSFLVLRARITELSPDLPIVWSRTLSSSTSSASLLRAPDDLKSAEAARQEYLDVIEGKGQVSIPFRVTVRAYDRPSGNRAGTAPPAFYWLQAGVELSPTTARRWLAGMTLGYTLIPQAYQGVMTQARLSRLLTGRSRSLTRPDLYAFTSMNLISVWGPATASFRNERLTTDQLLTDNAGDDPRATFGAMQIGAELRLGNRIGFAAFLEAMPEFNWSNNFGAWWTFATVNFQAIGGEVVFVF